jgi:hypothetical protein
MARFDLHFYLLPLRIPVPNASAITLVGFGEILIWRNRTAPQFWFRNGGSPARANCPINGLYFGGNAALWPMNSRPTSASSSAAAPLPPRIALSTEIFRFNNLRESDIDLSSGNEPLATAIL